MASATVIIVLACLFIVNTKVCSELENETFIKGGTLGPLPAYEAEAPLPQTSPITGIMCIMPCLMRCKAYNFKCIRACYKCCNLCRCVPYGPADNKDECGICYAGMVTASGKHKCP